MSKLSFWFLLLLFFSVAWVDSILLPYIGFASRLLTFLLVYVVAHLVFVRGRIKPVGLTNIFLIFFFVWAVLSITWSVSLSATLRRLLVYIQFLAMVWVVWELADTKDKYRQLMKAFILGCFVGTVGSILNYFLGSEVVLQRFAMPGYTISHFGFILVIAFPIAYYLLLVERSRIQKVLLVAYLVISCAAIFLTGSRAIFLQLIVAMIIIPWSLLEVPNWRKILLWTFLVTLSVLVLVIYFDIPGVARMLTTFEMILAGDYSGRANIWHVATSSFKENPVWGSGAGAFVEATRDHARQYYSRDIGAHNTFLSLLVEVGLVGILLFIMPFIFNATRLLNTRGLETKLCYILLGCLLIRFLPTVADYHRYTWIILGLVAVIVRSLYDDRLGNCQRSC